MGTSKFFGLDNAYSSNFFALGKLPELIDSEAFIK